MRLPSGYRKGHQLLELRRASVSVVSRVSRFWDRTARRMIDDTSRINQEMTEGLALLGHSSYYGWLCSRELCPWQTHTSQSCRQQAKPGEGFLQQLVGWSMSQRLSNSTGKALASPRPTHPTLHQQPHRRQGPSPMDRYEAADLPHTPYTCSPGCSPVLPTGTSGPSRS
jgi:hypothetical protein